MVETYAFFSVAVTTSLLVKTFIGLTEHNKIFKDVWRDLGILEISVNQLHSYAYNLKKELDAGTFTRYSSIYNFPHPITFI